MLSPEQFQELYNSIKNNTTPPSWFVTQYKTISSRNITIEDWNRMCSNLKNLAVDYTNYETLINAIYQQLLEVTETCNDLVLSMGELSDRIDELTLDMGNKVNVDLYEYPALSLDAPNENLTLFVNNNHEAARITIDDLRDRIIRTVDDTPQDIQNMQYTFENIKGEN